MGFAEIKKAVNSNLNKALDILIVERSTATDNNINSNIANVISNIRAYILESKNELLSHINSKTAESVHATNVARDNINAHVTNSINAKAIVKNVQRGRIDQSWHTDRELYVDIRISAVNMSKTTVNFNTDAYVNENRDSSNYTASIQLVNESTLRIYRTYQSGSTYQAQGNWEVVEYY